MVGALTVPRPTNPSIELNMLGEFSITARGSEIEVPRSCQQLVALVALRGPLSRSRARATLWPDADESAAQHDMRTLLWRLGQRVQILSKCGDTLSVSIEVRVDIHQMVGQARRLLGQLAGGTKPEASAWPDPAVFLDVVGWADSMELLPGWDEVWLAVERERLRQLYVHALETAARCLIDHGSLGLALDTALRVSAIDPLRESPIRLIVDVLLREGDVVGARRTYCHYEALLRSELNLIPSAELSALVRRRTSDVR